jgi:hypothetical protein
MLLAKSEKCQGSGDSVPGLPPRVPTFPDISVINRLTFIHEGGLHTVPMILTSGLSLRIPRPKSTRIYARPDSTPNPTPGA